jgi:hypothetical protein
MNHNIRTDAPGKEQPIRFITSVDEFVDHGLRG